MFSNFGNLKLSKKYKCTRDYINELLECQDNRFSLISYNIFHQIQDSKDEKRLSEGSNLSGDKSQSITSTSFYDLIDCFDQYYLQITFIICHLYCEFEQKNEITEISFSNIFLRMKRPQKFGYKTYQIAHCTQHRGFVCAYHPVTAGSNPKHSIYAFFNLQY